MTSIPFIPRSLPEEVMFQDFSPIEPRVGIAQGRQLQLYPAKVRDRVLLVHAPFFHGTASSALLGGARSFADLPDHVLQGDSNSVRTRHLEQEVTILRSENAQYARAFSVVEERLHRISAHYDAIIREHHEMREFYEKAQRLLDEVLSTKRSEHFIATSVEDAAMVDLDWGLICKTAQEVVEGLGWQVDVAVEPPSLILKTPGGLAEEIGAGLFDFQLQLASILGVAVIENIDVAIDISDDETE